MRDGNIEELLGAIEECVEHCHGLRHDLRTTILPAPPEAMGAAEIQRLRERTARRRPCSPWP